MSIFNSDHSDTVFDSLIVLHNGIGAEYTTSSSRDYRIWSHFSKMYYFKPNGAIGNFFDIGGLRVNDFVITSGLYRETNSILHPGGILHELGHYLGLPDLYDSDASSFGSGPYSLMSDAWGRDSSQNYPSSICAPSKFFLGWQDRTTMLFDKTNAPVEGVYSFNTFTSSNDMFVIKLSEYEYFIVEWRPLVGKDIMLPKNGILVWRVNYKPWNTNIGHANKYEFKLRNKELLNLDNAPGLKLCQQDDREHLENKYVEYDGKDVYGYSSAYVSDSSICHLNEYHLYNQSSQLKLYNFQVRESTATFEFSFKNKQPPSNCPSFNRRKCKSKKNRKICSWEGGSCQLDTSNCQLLRRRRCKVRRSCRFEKSTSKCFNR